MARVKYPNAIFPKALICTARPIVSISRRGWRCPDGEGRFAGLDPLALTGAVAETANHKDVEEMHAAQHDEHEADLGAKILHHLRGIGGVGTVAQRQGHIADVYEVEAHDQQMVD